MALMGALKEQLNDEKQQTENGAIGYRTSGRHLLDLNFAVGSMRNWGMRESSGNTRKHIMSSRFWLSNGFFICGISEALVWGKDMSSKSVCTG